MSARTVSLTGRSLGSKFLFGMHRGARLGWIFNFWERNLIAEEKWILFLNRFFKMLFCRSAADGYEHQSCSNGQIQGKSCARWQLEHCGRMKTILLIYIFYNDYWQDIKAEPVDVEVLDVFSLWRASSSSALDVTNFYIKKSSLISQFPLPTSYHFRGAWEGEWSCSPPGSCWRLPPAAPSRPPARPGRRSSPEVKWLQSFVAKNVALFHQFFTSLKYG